MAADSASGPLRGLRVIELGGLGPVPFCGMLLSDLGAEVLLVDRDGAPPPDPSAVTRRGRHFLTLDLKRAEDRDRCLEIVATADVLLEGFRPGVMERLGLGPDVVLAANPRLVFGRMTGWGQTGPYATMAGHDLDYIAVTGALHAIGPAEQPLPPLNVVGDFGGGALYLAVGVLAALSHARRTGVGQVVDCAISDGATSLMAMLYGYLADGRWQDRRASNHLDGAAPFYGTYRCADGRWVAVAAIEPKFYAELVTRLGLAGELGTEPPDRSRWTDVRRVLAARFATATRDEWCARLEGTDACFAPVMSMEEAPLNPHQRARGAFEVHDGVVQPAPAPRFSATPGAVQVGTSDPADVRGLVERWRTTCPAVGDKPASSGAFSS